MVPNHCVFKLKGNRKFIPSKISPHAFLVRYFIF